MVNVGPRADVYRRELTGFPGRARAPVGARSVAMLPKGSSSLRANLTNSQAALAVSRGDGIWSWWSAVGLARGPFERALGFGTRCITGGACADQVDGAVAEEVRGAGAHPPVLA